MKAKTTTITFTVPAEGPQLIEGFSLQSHPYRVDLDAEFDHLNVACHEWVKAGFGDATLSVHAERYDLEDGVNYQTPIYSTWLEATSQWSDWRNENNNELVARN